MYCRQTKCPKRLSCKLYIDGLKAKAHYKDCIKPEIKICKRYEERTN